jgi:hypothetical protein
MINWRFLRRNATKAIYVAASEGASGSFRMATPSLIHPLMPPKVQWFVWVDDEGVAADIRAAQQQQAKDGKHRQGR